MAAKLKRQLVLGLAGLLYYSGLTRVWIRLRHRKRRGNDICVIGLHRVLNDKELQQSNSLRGIILTQRTFEAIVAFLQKHFSFVRLEEFLSGAGSRTADSRLHCLLTFDDGWRDNFSTALPVLKRQCVPAVVFVVTELIGTGETFWVERLARIWNNEESLRASIVAAAGLSNHTAAGTTLHEVVERLKHMPTAQRNQIFSQVFRPSDTGTATSEGDRMLTWEEARALQKENVEIEAHTSTHPLLVYEDDATVRRELCDCRTTLDQKLGKRARAFAYPNGTWDKRVRNMVEEAGYECAFTTERGWHRPGSDRFAIRRIMLHEGMVTGPNGKFSPALLSLRLSGLI